jgi:thymidylate synthase (FAD)
MTRQIDKSCAVKRTTVPALEAILGHAFPVLDHGFVRVIDYLGDDSAICQMARVSYGEGTKSAGDDAGLIRYLMRQHHTSPFEGCEIKLHVKLPIFVARQWIRHRTANVNEYSGRYSIMKNEFYVPEAERLGRQSTTNKQGTGQGYDADAAAKLQAMLFHSADQAFDIYDILISDDYDLSRELARINLPLSTYSEWYWKIDLHNLMHFMRLRADAHAQWEIVQFAKVIDDIVRQWGPVSHQAYLDYRQNAVTFSAMEMQALRDYFAILQPHREDDGWPEPKGLSERELREFFDKLKLA